MMVREIEKTGIPVVHVVSMTPISLSGGVNRILTSYGIPNPMSDPYATPQVQERQRYEIMEKALEVLCTDIQEQTVFDH